MSDAKLLFSDIILQIFELNGLLENVGNEIAGKEHLGTSQWKVMGAVSSGNKSVAQIARAMGLSRQSVQRTANVLVDSGLAEFLDNPDHKRAKLLVLTSQGESKLKRIMKHYDRWIKVASADLDEATLESNLSFLKRMQSRFEQKK